MLEWFASLRRMRVLGAPLSRKLIVATDYRPFKPLAKNWEVGKKRGNDLLEINCKRLIPL